MSAQDRPKTSQRTYRFDTESFEEDCAPHLANPKLVIPALILHWLMGDVIRIGDPAHRIGKTAMIKSSERGDGRGGHARSAISIAASG